MERHKRHEDETITLTNTERWCLREALAWACHGWEGKGATRLELAEYFVEKCAKNAVPKERVEYLLDAFDFDDGLDLDELVEKYVPAH